MQACEISLFIARVTRPVSHMSFLVREITQLFYLDGQTLGAVLAQTAPCHARNPLCLLVCPNCKNRNAVPLGSSPETLGKGSRPCSGNMVFKRKKRRKKKKQKTKGRIDGQPCVSARPPPASGRISSRPAVGCNQLLDATRVFSCKSGYVSLRIFHAINSNPYRGAKTPADAGKCPGAKITVQMNATLMRQVLRVVSTLSGWKRRRWSGSWCPTLCFEREVCDTCCSVVFPSRCCWCRRRAKAQPKSP